MVPEGGREKGGEGGERERRGRGMGEVDMVREE